LENINGSNSTIISCDFTDNSTDSYGGAVFNAHESLPTFVNCNFSGNIASSGGGMYNENSIPTLIDCVFTSNSTTGSGGGMYNNSSDSVLLRCLFSNNSAERSGGGMYNRYTSQPSLTNCIFNANSARNGGGIENLNTSHPLIFNCTFSANIAEDAGGGISNIQDSKLTMINCILWDNTAPNGAQIYDEQGNSTSVSYSDVQYSGRSTWPGEGNIKTDPLFAVPDNGDYHLKSSAGRWDPNSQSWVLDDVNSPCIDAGDPNSPIGDEPIPNGGRINMGAYGGTSQASLSQLSLAEMKASDPYPYDAAVGVEINPTLSWSSGATAVAHDVYFGTSYNNVNNATVTNPLGVLVSQGQTSNSYNPGTLSYNRTYYWRVDEVDEQGNRTKGDIWLFITRDSGAKGRACFLPNTPVWVDGGFVPISTVAAGQIAGASNTAIVEKLQEHVGMFECRDVILENGNCVSVVESHYFLLESGIWISSLNLRSGMKLKTMNGTIAIKSVRKREMPYVGKVYNVKVSGTHRYMVGEDAIIVRDY